MERLSNRNHNKGSETVVQYVYVEKEAEVREPETIVVEKEVPVEVEKVVYRDAQVDLGFLNEFAEKQQKYNAEIQAVVNRHADGITQVMHWCNLAKEELEMQRRALVGLKAQRDVDRKRRLTLIKKMKSERNTAQKREFKLKLAVGASLLLSIVSLIVKL